MVNKSQFEFTFDNIEKQYASAINQDYTFCTCAEFVKLKRTGLPDKLIVNRVDVDLSVKGADRLAQIYNRLGIKGSFFIRLHAPEYNRRVESAAPQIPTAHNFSSLSKIPPRG